MGKTIPEYQAAIQGLVSVELDRLAQSRNPSSRIAMAALHTAVFHIDKLALIYDDNGVLRNEDDATLSKYHMDEAESALATYEAFRTIDSLGI